MEEGQPEKITTMDKKSKILFFVFFLLILAAVGASFCRYIIWRDYYIEFQTECDPSKEKCFVTVCDPATDDTCSKDETKRTSYYKLLLKKAYAMPNCDPNADENCIPKTCGNDKSCQEIFCDEKTVKEGETCNDPATYKPGV